MGYTCWLHICSSRCGGCIRVFSTGLFSMKVFDNFLSINSVGICRPRSLAAELKYMPHIHTVFYTISLAILSFLPRSNSWELSESGRARFRRLPYREFSALNGPIFPCQLAGFQVFIQRWCRGWYLVPPRNGSFCLAPVLP